MLNFPCCCAVVLGMHHKKRRISDDMTFFHLKNSAANWFNWLGYERRLIEFFHSTNESQFKMSPESCIFKSIVEMAFIFFWTKFWLTVELFFFLKSYLRLKMLNQSMWIWFSNYFMYFIYSIASINVPLVHSQTVYCFSELKKKLPRNNTPWQKGNKMRNLLKWVDAVRRGKVCGWLDIQRNLYAACKITLFCAQSALQKPNEKEKNTWSLWHINEINWHWSKFFFLFAPFAMPSNIAAAFEIFCPPFLAIQSNCSFSLKYLFLRLDISHIYSVTLTFAMKSNSTISN